MCEKSMKKFLLVIIFVGVFVGFSVFSAVLVQNIYEVGTNANLNWSSQSGFGQAIKSSVILNNVEQLTFRLRKVGVPSGYVQVSLQTSTVSSGGGVPTGTVLASASDMLANNLLTAWDEIVFLLSSPVDLSVDTEYWLVVKVTDPSNSSDNYVDVSIASGDLYSNGSNARWNVTLSEWVFNGWGSAYDAYFVVESIDLPAVPVVTNPVQSQSIRQYFWPLGTCEYDAEWTNLVVRLKDDENNVIDSNSTKCLSDGTWSMVYGYPDGQNDSFLVASAGNYALNVKQCEDADLNNCTAWSSDLTFQVGPDAPSISIPIDEQIIWESYYDLSGSCEYMGGWWDNIHIESATGTTLLSYTNAWCQSNGTWTTASGTSLQIWPGGQDIWAKQIVSSYYVSATSSVIQVWGNLQLPPGSDVPFEIPWGTYSTTTPWVTATSATSTLSNVPYEFQWLGGFFKDVLYWLFVPDADFLRYAWTWTSGQFLTMPIWTIPNEAYYNIKNGLVKDSDLPDRQASVMGMSVNLNTLVPELAEQLAVPLDAFNSWFRLILAIMVVAHISGKIRALFSDERFAEVPF